MTICLATRLVKSFFLIFSLTLVPKDSAIDRYHCPFFYSPIQTNEVVFALPHDELIVDIEEVLQAEILDTTLIISRFRFLKIRSWLSELRVIILQGTQILKVVS